MAINLYLNFNGNCREAVDFYAKVFETEKQSIMTYGDMPESPDHKISHEQKNLILHTNLSIYGTNVMFSDIPPGMEFNKGNNISLSINDHDINKIKTLFDKLKDGGTVEMPLEKTFWSECFGMLTDKFGTIWQLNYENK